VKFGKLNSVDGVDFEVPALSIAQPNTSSPKPPKIFLGTTGWSNKEWVGAYYPSKAKTSEYLSHYGKLFDTIELNTTHYQIPSTEKVDKWCNQVDSSFKFCPKVPQDISHRSNIGSETSQTRTFFKSILSMDQNLGPCFMQLPEYFDPSQIDKLLHFLSRKPQNLPFAIELRHPKWFVEDNFHLKLLLPELTKTNTSLVITDVAGRRDVSHSLLSNPTLILRLVGNGLHPSDFTRMDRWIERIVALGAQLNEVFIFFHQPQMTQIPDMVNHFIEKAAKSGLNLGLEPVKPIYEPNIQLRLF